MRDTGQHGLAYLGGNSVGLADLVTPEASPDRDNGELCEDDGATNGSGHFLAALNAQTDVSVVVSNG
jgi:hypothetical protein